jgi:predicted CXXCH cytochrome family protein
MRRLIVIVAILAFPVASGFAVEPPPPPQGPPPFETSCFSCHSELEMEPTEHARDDVHFQRGLSCHDCHGGNPAAGADGDMDAAHDPSHDFRGKPTRKQLPKFCARCHSDATFMKRYNPVARVDQLSEYRTSRHGQRHAEGDMKTAVCTDCHGVHGIRPIKDPRSPVYPTRVADTCARCHNNGGLMASYGITTGQVADYRRSVHAAALYDDGDTFSPTCNDCHGSHGAVPPGVNSVANVCGSCHGREGSLFRETTMGRSVALEVSIQCTICHSNHAVLPPTDDMLGVQEGSTCSGCHNKGDKGYQTAERMKQTVVKLTDDLAEARELLEQAERAGIAVGPDQFALQKAQDALIESKVLVHSFDLDRFLQVAEEGVTVAEAGIAAGHEAFEELRFRRTGLGLSLIVIVAVIGALMLKIRAIERGGDAR